MASAWIFPTTNYGQPTDVYGTQITQYASNTNGLPGGAGLILGQFGLLFDGTTLKLCKIGANAPALYDAVVLTPAQGNDYTVTQSTATANTQFVMGVCDRFSQSTALTANASVVWITTYGLGTGNVVTGVTAPSLLTTSGTTAGRLIAATVGTSFNANIILPTTTTVSGANPVIIR